MMLDDDPGLPEGQPVIVIPAMRPASDEEGRMRLLRAAGAWAGDDEEGARSIPRMESAATQGQPARDRRVSFLLDTDIASAYLKNHARVITRVTMHYGSLHVSVVTVGELLTWAGRAKAPPSRLQGVLDLLSVCQVLDVDYAAAETFGRIRADLLDRGRTVGELDLFNASVALVHNLTVVTHNVADYRDVPGLSIVDWMVP